MALAAQPESRPFRAWTLAGKGRWKPTSRLPCKRTVRLPSSPLGQAAELASIRCGPASAWSQERSLLKCRRSAPAEVRSAKSPGQNLLIQVSQKPEGVVLLLESWRRLLPVSSDTTPGLGVSPADSSK